MAKVEKTAPSNEWHFSLWTADDEVWIQENSYVHTMSEGVCREQEHWTDELSKETISHIQNAGCLGQKEVVTATHNACIRELLREVSVHGKADRHMRLNVMPLQPCSSSPTVRGY